MNRGSKFALLAVGLMLVSVLAVYVSFQLAPLDPLAEFRTPDGKLSIPGGAFTKELQNLLFPPPAPKSYWTYAPERSGYPTLNIQGTEHDISQQVKASAVAVAGLRFDFLGQLRAAFGQVFDFFSGSAAAVDRFAVFDDVACTATTVATDAECWSTTTNGAGNGLPVAGDNLILDNGSGAVNGSMGASLNVTTGEITFCGSAGVPIAACGGAWVRDLNIATNSLTNTGAFRVSGGGSITISTGTIDGGAATFVSAGSFIISGAATLIWDGITMSAETFPKGTATLTVQGNFTMSGTADLTSTSGAVSITGNVDIQAVTNSIDFGSEAWTVSGTWTNASTDATWDAGTGTVTFTSATGGTMTFAGTNLAENEFKNVTFTSSAGTAQTFTMVTRLRLGGTLTISDASSTTRLNATADLITTGAMTIGLGGILTANANTIELSGNWDSSAGTFTVGTSTVRMNATGAIASATVSSFYNLVILAGTSTPSNNLDIDNILQITGGATFAKNIRELTVNGSMSIGNGSLTSTSGSVTIGGDVTITNAAGFIDFGSETWTVSGDWDNASTSASWDAGTGTIIFDGAALQTIGDTEGTGTNNIFNNVVVMNGDKDFTSDFSTADFTLDDTVNRTVTMDAGMTWTISSKIQTTGGSTLFLRSSINGTYWFLQLVGDSTARNVNVRDSNASSQIIASSSFNAGHNVNWIFGGAGGGLPPTTPPPGPFEPAIPLPTDPATVSLYVAGIGTLLLVAGRFLPVLKTAAKWGPRFRKTGLIMLVLGFFAWFFLFMQ